jgi:hypothetical protein
MSSQLQSEVSEILGLKEGCQNGRIRKVVENAQITSFYLNVDGSDTLGITLDDARPHYYSRGGPLPVLETAKLMAHINTHLEAIPCNLEIFNRRELFEIPPKIGTCSVEFESNCGSTILTSAFVCVLFQGYEFVFYVGDNFSIHHRTPKYPYSFEKAVEELGNLALKCTPL